MKTCFKCGVEKELSEFYAHKRMADGHLNKCKECTKKDVKTRYVDDFDKVQEYEKSRANLPHRVKARNEYSKSEHGREVINAIHRKWQRGHPIQRAANILLGNSVRDGSINKPCTCSACGKESKRIEGHHDDYAFPLSVRWLCNKCHVEWHCENKPLNGD